MSSNSVSSNHFKNLAGILLIMLWRSYRKKTGFYIPILYVPLKHQKKKQVDYLHFSYRPLWDSIESIGIIFTSSEEVLSSVPVLQTQRFSHTWETPDASGMRHLLWTSKICTPCSILLKEFPKCWRTLSDNLRDRDWKQVRCISSIIWPPAALCMRLSFTMPQCRDCINIFSHNCETPHWDKAARSLLVVELS